MIPVPIRAGARRRVDDAAVSLDGVFLRDVHGLTPAALGALLAANYAHDALQGAGWALGSLGILGNPANLARSVAAAVTALVAQPYHGSCVFLVSFLFVGARAPAAAAWWAVSPSARDGCGTLQGWRTARRRLRPGWAAARRPLSAICRRAR